MGMVEITMVASSTIGMFVIVMVTGAGQETLIETLTWALVFAGAAFLLSLVILHIGGKPAE